MDERNTSHTGAPRPVRSANTTQSNTVNPRNTLTLQQIRQQTVVPQTQQRVRQKTATTQTQQQTAAAQTRQQVRQKTSAAQTRQRTAAPQPRTNSHRSAGSRSRQPVKAQHSTSSRTPKKKRLPSDPKERTSVFSLLVLIPLFCILTLYMLILPRSTVSKIENRNLASFPSFSLSSYLSGEFTAGIAEWYGDTVPFRDSLKNASYKLQSLYGITTEDTITLIAMDPSVLVGAANADTDEHVQPFGNTTAGNSAGGTTAAGKATGSTTTDTPTKADTVQTGSNTADDSTADTTEAATSDADVPAESDGTEQPETETDAQAAAQKDYTAEEAENELTNGLLIVKQDGHWRCLGLYGAGSGETYAEALNYLRAQLDSSVNIYSMPAPLASQYYLPSNAVSYSDNQEENMTEVAAKLDEGITYVNLFPVLAQHTSELIYSRTDHHWAPLGAYYAAQAMAQAAGVPFADLSQYEVNTTSGYVGTMYSYSQDVRLLEDSEDFVTYIPTCQYTAEYFNEYYEYRYDGDLILDHGNYLNFMGTDDTICKITTNVGNGRKLLIVKDSYGNAEVPCYTSSFDEIYVTDMRYLQCNLINLIQDLGITDVLFTMCVYSVVGGNADNLMPLMTQNPDLHFSADYYYEEPAEDVGYEEPSEEYYEYEEEPIEPEEYPDYAEE